jgi:hypothetical protein
MKAPATVLGLIAAGLLGGCAGAGVPRDFVPVVARFFLEAAGNDGVPVTLPQSGVNVIVNPKPVITEGDIVNVELVQVELGRCLMFQLSPSAARDFYRLSVTHLGRRIALLLDGAPAGARRLDGAIGDGVIYVFVERPDEALPALVQQLKKSSAALQRAMARSG